MLKTAKISFGESIANASIILETKVREKCILSHRPVSEMTKHILVLQLFDRSCSLGTYKLQHCSGLRTQGHTSPKNRFGRILVFEKCSQSQEISERRCLCWLASVPGHMQSSSSTITHLNQHRECTCTGDKQ